MRRRGVSRSPFCFFCAKRADVILDDAWAILALQEWDEEARAWLCHLPCLHEARHPDAPE
jgi:hypothetical protein